MKRAEQVDIEAANWLILRQEGELPPEEQTRFEAWLAASDRHKAAYWRLEYGWEEADRIGALGRASVEPDEVPHARNRRFWWAPLALAASLAAVIGGWQIIGQRSAVQVTRRAPVVMAPATYSTPIGGARLVNLVDGSRIQLNTQSTVRTEITASRREVWLDKGEVFFEVAHRADQPFIVHAGDRQITVLGTKFGVRRDGGKVLVTVLEGRVRVDDMAGNRPARSSIIVGGEMALAEGQATMLSARSKARVESALSWRDGILTFDEQPLPAIAAEFNRYNVKKLVVDGQGVGAIRITGVFATDKPDAFARLLRDAYGLDIQDTPAEIRVSR